MCVPSFSVCGAMSMHALYPSVIAVVVSSGKWVFPSNASISIDETLTPLGSVTLAQINGDCELT